MLGLIMVGVKMERLRRRWFEDYEFRISEVGGKGKDGTHEMIVDNTPHPIVFTPSAYQAFKTLEY
jgi:hypothetical protein